jgi:hypothetical protein
MEVVHGNYAVFNQRFLCEDTSKNFELFDLLKQADPNYSAVDPARIKLYVYDGTKYVEATTGYFTAVDKDTFTVDATQLPNFNGEQKVRVLGTDSTGNTFVLDLQINVTPVNDAPSGADDSANVASGDGTCSDWPTSASPIRWKATTSSRW